MLRQMTARGRDQLIPAATEALQLLCEAVDLSWARMRDLEDRYPRLP
jgi:hypothetical protein